MGILRTDKISGLEKEKGQNPNLVANGDFSEASTIGWTGYNAVISYDSGAGGRIKVDDSAAAGGWSNAAYVVNTEPGASYRFEVRASASDSDSHYVGYYQGTYDTAGTEPTVYSSEITVNPSVHYFNFIATGTTVTIMLIANGAGVVYFDDVSVRKIDGNSIGGSVHFDGNDHLSIGASGEFNFLHNGLTDWTAEFWAKVPNATRQFVFGTGASSAQIGFSLTIMSSADNQSDATGVYAQFGRGAAGNYRYWGTSSGLVVNTWHHIAAVFKSSDKTLALYIDGREVDNDSGTASGTFGSGNYSSSNSSYAFIVGKNQHGGGNYITGYISNLRVVAGRRLYTSDFTPPVHELEPIDGTVVLCCNNPDSVTTVSNAGIGTAHIGTSSGNPVNSTENPGLSRDFTSGTEFKGVTTFDTQGYFVPPSGTTEQRGRGRGIFGGAYLTPQGANARIEYIETSSSGNGLDFGDMSSTAMMSTALADSTRSVFAGGYSGGVINTIEFVTIATTSNTTNFGDLSESKRHMASCASNTKGVWSGGTTTGSTNCTTTLDNVTIQSLGNAVDYGDLSAARRSHGGASSPTRGVFAAGNTNTPTPANAMNVIDYITIATGGTAADFGDRSVVHREIGASSDSTRMVMGGGWFEAGSTETNYIDYITIATTGNAQEFGDLSQIRTYANGLSNSIRGLFGGGADSPVYRNTIDYVTIQSTGNAIDFGDLIQERLGYANAACDSHGGLS